MLTIILEDGWQSSVFLFCFQKVLTYDIYFLSISATKVAASPEANKKANSCEDSVFGRRPSFLYALIF